MNQLVIEALESRLHSIQLSANVDTAKKNEIIISIPIEEFGKAESELYEIMMNQGVFDDAI